ncbi:flippase-like domain-containing protein [Candidatus Woesearchaeota archaeon]|nr:flippase-like domain-containing protein [Candidatus Woesearchaeota archaeon]
MKKTLIAAASAIFGLLLLIVIYSNIEDILAPFVGAPLLILIPYFLITIIMHGFHTWRWSLVLESMGHKIDFKKLYSLRIMGYSINYITPTARIGGEPVKAAILREDNVSLAEGISSIIIDKSFEVLAGAVLGLIGIIIVGLAFALPNDTIYYLVILSIASIIALAIVLMRAIRKGSLFLNLFRMLGLHKIKKLKDVEKQLEKTSENIRNFFMGDTKAFQKAVYISMAMWGLMFVEYWLLLLMLGFYASIFQIFIIISFVGLAYFIPVPAAIGVLEAGQVSAFTILRLNPNLGIATAFIIRAKDLLITFIGLTLLSIKGVRVKKFFD